MPARRCGRTPAGAQRCAGLHTLQILAEGGTTLILKVLQQFFGNAGRALAVCDNARHHHSADQCAAGAFHAAHAGGIACAQLHQGVGIYRQPVLKCLQHRLCAVALSGGFPCGSLRCPFFNVHFTILFLQSIHNLLLRSTIRYRPDTQLSVRIKGISGWSAQGHSY